jgi:hypothetical protein
VSKIVVVQLVVVVVHHVFVGLFGVPDLILHQVIESPILDQHSRKIKILLCLLAIVEKPRNHTGWDEEHLLFGLLGQEFRGAGLKELEDQVGFRFPIVKSGTLLERGKLSINVPHGVGHMKFQRGVELFEDGEDLTFLKSSQ